MSPFSVPCVFKVLAAPRIPARWQELIAPVWRMLLNRYRPELYYMRGPGPKWREKHLHATARQVPLVQTRDRMIARSEANYPHEVIRARNNSAGTQGGTISDGALIAAIARGDQQAMRRLYERHSANVYRYACRLGRDQSTAEDLVSEVFLVVWRCAGAFEGRAQISIWLLATARNRTLDTIRRRSLESLDEIESRTIEVRPPPRPRSDATGTVDLCCAEPSEMSRSSSQRTPTASHWEILRSPRQS
jgi:RNA polymerase sigma factor (sigma-70 family)